jgi:myo-inositol-1(or 4)-monophosphatase
VTEPATPGEAIGALDAVPGPSVEEWLGAFRQAVEAQRRVFAEHEGVAARSEYDGIGEGGDRTLVIDRLCEDAIFDELETLHSAGHEFTAVSEERGSVSFAAADTDLRLVIDPIDGSLNARRTIPCHSVSIAVADGPSMADVRLGYVYEFGAGEEFVAVAGGGASLAGRRLSVPEGDGLELVAIEASKPERVIAAAQVLDGRAYRIRCPGSIAVSLSYVAAGRFDGMFSTRSCRSVDAAAAQLILREAGGRLSFGDADLNEVPLDLEARYDVAGARTPGDLAVLREAQKAVG